MLPEPLPGIIHPIFKRDYDLFMSYLDQVIITLNRTHPIQLILKKRSRAFPCFGSVDGRFLIVLKLPTGAQTLHPSTLSSFLTDLPPPPCSFESTSLPYIPWILCHHTSFKSFLAVLVMKISTRGALLRKEL